MTTFTLWNRDTRSAGDEVTVKLAEVESVADSIQRDTNGRKKFCTLIILKGGKKIILTLPAGEVQDRLNDDVAVAPDLGGMGNMFDDPDEGMEDEEPA